MRQLITPIRQLATSRRDDISQLRRCMPAATPLSSFQLIFHIDTNTGTPHRESATSHSHQRQWLNEITVASVEEILLHCRQTEGRR